MVGFLAWLHCSMISGVTAFRSPTIHIWAHVSPSIRPCRAVYASSIIARVLPLSGRYKPYNAMECISLMSSVTRIIRPASMISQSALHCLTLLSFHAMVTPVVVTFVASSYIPGVPIAVCPLLFHIKNIGTISSAFLRVSEHTITST
jgi:hypothetical protein